MKRTLENLLPKAKAEKPTPAPEASVEMFLQTFCELRATAEVEAAQLYRDYQTDCERNATEPVNRTAFAVQLMNHYRDESVERDEVMRGRHRVEIYRGLALKADARSKVKPRVRPSPARVETPDVKPQTRVVIQDVTPEEMIGDLGEVPAALNLPDDLSENERKFCAAWFARFGHDIAYLPDLTTLATLTRTFTQFQDDRATQTAATRTFANLLCESGIVKEVHSGAYAFNRR